MQTGKQTKFFTATTSLLLIIMLLQHAAAQRPSFAGSRPAGGLNQLDKYHNTQNAFAGSSQDVGIANRFGVADPQPVTIAYGVSQRPPSGVVLVHPQTQYVPLDTQQTQPQPQPQLSVETRFGETPTNGSSGQAAGNAINNNATANRNSIAFATPAVSRPSTLPHDAHGDIDLIEKLSRLPVDKQPFWFINYQAIEAQRNSSRPSVGALETRGSFFG